MGNADRVKVRSGLTGGPGKQWATSYSRQSIKSGFAGTCKWMKTQKRPTDKHLDGEVREKETLRETKGKKKVAASYSSYCERFLLCTPFSFLPINEFLKEQITTESFGHLWLSKEARITLMRILRGFRSAEKTFFVDLRKSLPVICCWMKKKNQYFIGIYSVWKLFFFLDFMIVNVFCR